MALRSLNATLVCSAGAAGTGGRVVLTLRVVGIAGLWATGSVGESDRPFRPFTLAASDFQELCRLADELDIARRDPRVSPRVDTSDSWSEILLHVAHEGGRRTMALGLLSSGFDGDDAPALRRFFALLLASAGVKDEGTWVLLTDAPPPDVT